MSSDEEPDSHTSKQPRRPQRSCDFCRQRKNRGDGVTGSNGDAISQCSTCVGFGVPCTYRNPAKQRGRKIQLVEELKQKIVGLESKLRSLSVCSLCAQPLQPLQDVLLPPRYTSESGNTPEEDVSDDELIDSFRQIAVEAPDNFFGSASSSALLRSAIAVKEKYLGPPMVAPYRRRQVYWELLPWEKELYDRQPNYLYPASDLIHSLLELYFTNVNPIFPVLHRPSFESCVAGGLHLKDARFGATLLAVLALASRYSDDPRVLIDGKTSLSSGWKFVAQVEIVQKCSRPTIYQVQFWVLMALYSLGTSAPQVSAMYLGLGIHWLQHRGEHQRKREGYDFEYELWNRAFWCFFALDRMVCSFVGRPPTLHKEDYDIDPLLEVDDEYWERGFTQPLGKPSLLSYFACFIRLCEILGDTYRLYASKKVKTRMGWTGTDWEQATVAELDSTMNDYFHSIPPHLERDSDTTPGVLMDQRGNLDIMYHHLQIMIHRPYIHNQSPMAAPSLSICTMAARSVLCVSSLWIFRFKRLPSSPWLPNFLFVSSVILLLNIFGAKRAGVTMDPEKDKLDFAEVETALDILKIAELRGQIPGRLRDLIEELLSRDGPAPRNEVNRSPGESNKVFSVSASSVESPVSFSGAIEEVYAPQPQQLFEPGMSIEQLLAGTDPISWDSSGGVSSGLGLDDETMSMWMAAPTDFMNMKQWDVYMENMNGADADWSSIQPGTAS
ncbi:fungal-specific transcription factor domain-containing protein [Mycena maculata]|uniref:Fungal-specific transcription factor domain-containing protein n=1 Tax=Mycena maculata TaxID=230809 RepID=A0AAD7JCF2_9AGAR|nr:fungal-specific transcription factor domain-containing protein [Mycena maculata]